MRNFIVDPKYRKAFRHRKHGGRELDRGLTAMECLKDIIEFVNGLCE
ncbi:unnamed protein product, partial [Rotaria sp. Silwood2]